MKRVLTRLLLSRLRRLLAARSPTFASPLEVERAEQMFYLNYLREGMTVFDVGANVGEMTLLFSRFVGAGKIHAFEPSEKCFARLSTVCAAAGRRNVVLNRRAVTEQAGAVRLHVYDDDHLSWNSIAQRPLANYGINIMSPTIEEVSATTLDSYCEEHRIERIDLLKIDTEGAEYQVLLSARRLLGERRIRCLTFEFGQTTFDMGNSPREIERYLGEMNYRVRNLVAGDPVFPGGANVGSACFSMHVATPR